MPSDAPAPAGIGKCASCPYLVTGTAAICYACARRTIEPLAPTDERCIVCDLPLKEDGTCGNPICSFDDRYFEWNYAIAMRSGVLERAINRFKYEGQHGWRIIFGRVLVGFLEDQAATFEGFDLIVASPTYVGEGSRRDYDHTRAVILAAADEAEGAWPFDLEEPAAILRTAEVPRLVGKNWRERKVIAEGPLREALTVPHRGRTHGKSILVYDDVFTDGFTLREVARCLSLEGGAASVCGVTLTRQKWSRG